jgi:excisionase family DNA binding protein
MSLVQHNLSPDQSTVDGLDNLFEADTSHVMPVTSDDVSSVEITVDTIPTWTLSEAAEELNISKRTILRKLKTGELQGRKVIGPNGPEWRIQPIDTPDMTNRFVKTSVNAVTSDEQSTGDNAHDTKFESLLKVIESQVEQLKAASQVIVYQQAQLMAKDEQIKLLTDSQHKQGWWARLKNRFTSGR